MSAPTLPASNRFAPISSHLWWVLLIGALGTFWIAVERRIDRVEALTNSPLWSVDAPQRDGASPTGFEKGQRMLIVPGHHNPSFSWITEAQQSAQQGQLRLRHISYDSQSDGRKIRRTALYRWWLVGVGWIRQALSGEPLGYAIGRGALLADPVLFALFLIAGAAYSARYFGSLAASAFVIGAISIFPLSANFQPGAPDPHSLAWVLALASVLPLLASPERSGSRRRVHFVIAGVFGGLGFWNDALSQGPVLVAIVLGGLAWELVNAGRAQAPQPWRAWALAGAATVLLASALEFLPKDFSWTALDAVSPMHALTWWGAGEVLGALSRWRRQDGQRFDRRSLAWLIAGAVALAVWPAITFANSKGSFLATDFYARELANHPGAGFARNLKAWLQQPTGDGFKWATLLPCALVFVVGIRAVAMSKNRDQSGRLLFALVLLVTAIVLASQQLRWWNLFDVFALTALTVLIAGAAAAALETRAWVLGSSLLALPGLFIGFPPAQRGDPMRNLSPVDAESLVERDFAHWLASRQGAEPTVLFSTPIFSGATGFYGGFDTIVSGDDGNEAGFRSAVRIASADTPQEAQRLLRLHRVTHVALPLWDPALDQLVRIGTNLPADQPIRPDTFIGALRNWGSPVWMRPLNYLVPEATGIQGFELRAYAVGPEQEPDLALARLVDVLIERGEIGDGEALRQSLAAYPRSLFALGALASLDLSRGDRAHVDESLEKLIPLLSRRWARVLPADQRISLAALFVQTKHLDLAKEQIEACLKTLDGDTLRQLTLGATVRLVALSQALHAPFPNPELEATAIQLIPPSIRANLTDPKHPHHP
jgi:hypothetical protein